MSDASQEPLAESIPSPSQETRHAESRAAATVRSDLNQAASDRAERAVAAHTAAGLIPASKFLGRLSQLDFNTLGEAVRTWHRIAAESGDLWFIVEESVARAVHDSSRYTEQDVLLRHMSTLFLESTWFTSAQPGVRIRAAEPSAQYVATIAMLALLVRDRLLPDEFELLYRPFAGAIPVDALLRE